MSNAVNQAALDVVIVGGGLVGASLGCMLGQTGIRAAVLEARQPPAADAPDYDDRTLALNLVSVRILDALGLWQALQPHATAIKEVKVSDHGRPGRVHLRARDHGYEAFGYSVEAWRLGQVLLNGLGQYDTIFYRVPCEVTGWSADESAAALGIREGEVSSTIHARLVVAADGARSSLRTLADIPARDHDYDQMAVVANVSPEQHHQHCAFEHFTRGGPLAVLPQPEGRCGTVWIGNHEDAQERLALSDEAYMRVLNQTFGERLGALQKIGRRASYPLRQTVAERLTGPRLLLLGNAAQAVHPVSAQGFNLGLRDAASLLDVLRDAADPGAPELVERYARSRQQDQQETIRYTDTLARLFSGRTPLHSLISTAALAAHELLPPLQEKLVLGAMGFRGTVPGLARQSAAEARR